MRKAGSCEHQDYALPITDSPFHKALRSSVHHIRQVST